MWLYALHGYELDKANNQLTNWSDVNGALLMFLQGIADLTLAYQCFKLTLAFNNDHAEAYNNLAVLELRKGHIEQVRKLL